MQGWRSHMEDDHIQLLTLSPELPHLSLFGIFDGHGGEMVAHYIAKHFPEHLLRTNKLTADQTKIEPQAKEAFEVALMAIDARPARFRRSDASPLPPPARPAGSPGRAEAPRSAAWAAREPQRAPCSPPQSGLESESRPATVTGAGLTGAMAVGGDGCHRQIRADCRRRRRPPPPPISAGGDARAAGRRERQGPERLDRGDDAALAHARHLLHSPVKVPPWQCPSSAPAPPQGAPDSSVWLARCSQGRDRPSGRPATASGARACRLQSRPFRRL